MPRSPDLSGTAQKFNFWAVFFYFFAIIVGGFKNTTDTSYLLHLGKLERMKNLPSLFFGILFCSFSGIAQNSIISENSKDFKSSEKTHSIPILNLSEANKLINLPLECIVTDYPYKPGETLESNADLVEPKDVHPIFYGCFDWHSAVHGYWSMVTLLQQFPDMERAQEVKAILEMKITRENVAVEMAFFEKSINKSFERTYGWAWLLKLSATLHDWDDPWAHQLELNLKPLADIIVLRYKEFLPKLNYPIRVGEHTNTAFGLSLGYDYAISVGDVELQHLIETRAKDFYWSDENCPISWEPSGYDFLSPCLEEVDIMRRVLKEDSFLFWLNKFLPQLEDKNYQLKVGEVSDRSDGKLVHLDGLNFSRAWVLYGLAKQFPKYKHLEELANQHFSYSYPNLIGDTYEGGHWLGSFAILAMNTAKSLSKE